MENPPPHSNESEQAFLASCMINAAQEGVELLTPDDFYSTAHQVIFKSISDLVLIGTDIDIVTVLEHIQSSNQLKKIGGAAYLSKIQDMVTGVSLESCAEIIKKNSTRRRIITACTKARQACMGPDDIDDVIGILNNEIVSAEQSLARESWIKISNLSDPMIEKWESEKGVGITGIPTGLADIDKALGGLQPANLIVIGGRPGMGKTAFAIKVAKGVSRHCPVGIRSIEMSKEQLFTRQVSDSAQVASERFRLGNLESYHWDRIVEAVGKLSRLPIYIDDRPTEKIQTLQRSIRQFVKRHGRGVIIIDYLQYITGIKSERKDIEIGTITRGLKATSRELNIPIILLAQLSRDVEKRDTKNRRPKKSDLRGSGEIEQDADIIAFLYRDEVYNPETREQGIAEFIIDKYRDGKTATIKLKWIDFRATFENLEYVNRM